MSILIARPNSAQFQPIEPRKVLRVECRQPANASQPAATQQVNNVKVASLMLSDSPLSALLGRRVNRIEIMTLFFKIMVLLLDSREQELMARKLQRSLYITSMEGVSGHLKDQGNTLLFTGIVAGLFSVLSGIGPMLGYCKCGESLKSAIGKVMSSANEVKDPVKFWTNMGKVFQGISQSSDNGGKIHGAFSQSSQTKQQTKGDISKTDWDELTRRREGLKKYVEEIENFIRQIFHLDQEVVRALVQH